MVPQKRSANCCLMGCGGCAGLFVLMAIGGMLGKSHTGSTSIFDDPPSKGTPAPASSVKPSALPAQEAKAPAAKPPLSDKEQAYVDKMRPQVADVGKGLQDIAERSKEAGEDPKLINDYDWKMKLIPTLATLEYAGGQLKDLGPVPRRFAKIDKLMKRIGGESEKAAKEYAHGVDHADLRSFTSSAKRIDHMTEMCKEATRELTTIMPDSP